MHLPAHRASRRTFIATAACAALATMSGCSPLGISNPTSTDASSSQADDPGTSSVTYDDVVITFTVDTSAWSWGRIDNSSSTSNGSITVAVPVHIKNESEGTCVFNSLSVSVLGPDDSKLPDISGNFDQDLLASTSVATGAEADSTLHILYMGSGTYSVEFDNMLGAKAEMKLDVPSAADAGIRALPASISSIDAGNAVPSGSSFDAEGLTLTLSADRESYSWVQASAAGNATWDGRWCVGVPVTVANHSDSAHVVSSAAYEKFNPALDMQDDPAPYFGDDVANAGAIAAGSTVSSMVYFVYDGDGNYYLAMDNNGTSVLATALIAQYY